MSDSRIAVVGGGIVGASVAYHLGRRTDDPVVVYERGDLASETTFKATAMVGVSGPDPYHRLQAYGVRLYNDFLADPESDVRYRESGRLRVATTDDGARQLARVAEAVDEGRTSGAGDGIDPSKFANGLVDYLPGDRLADRLVVPPLATDRIEGALSRPEYGYVLDDSRTLGARQLALEFVERARDDGVRFESHTEVTDVVTDGDGVTGVEIDGTEAVDVDAVVCAAGPWNHRVAAAAGVDLPIDHVRSPVFALVPDEPLPYSLPMIKSHESSVGIHPKREDRVLVTYTPDPGGSRFDHNPDAVGDGPSDEDREIALEWAERLLPSLTDAELVDEWVGVGTVTPDGHPIAGWTAVEGLVLASTMAGIQYAPAVGSVVARQLVERDPTEYYDAVAISRFEDYHDVETRTGID